MARASRLSGEIDEEERELEQLMQEKSEHPSSLVRFGFGESQETLDIICLLMKNSMLSDFTNF
jgi:hypothetical protein